MGCTGRASDHPSPEPAEPVPPSAVPWLHQDTARIHPGKEQRQVLIIVCNLLALPYGIPDEGSNFCSKARFIRHRDEGAYPRRDFLVDGSLHAKRPVDAEQLSGSAQLDEAGMTSLYGEYSAISYTVRW